MKKKRKTRKLFLVLLIIVLLLAALSAVFVLTRKKEGSALLPSNITTEQAHIGTIRLTTEGNGFIEPADDVLISSDYTMKIDTVEVENGDVVAAGDENGRYDLQGDDLADKGEAVEQGQVFGPLAPADGHAVQHKADAEDGVQQRRQHVDEDAQQVSVH